MTISPIQMTHFWRDIGPAQVNMRSRATVALPEEGATFVHSELDAAI